MESVREQQASRRGIDSVTDTLSSENRMEVIWVTFYAIGPENITAVAPDTWDSGRLWHLWRQIHLWNKDSTDAIIFNDFKVKPR